MAWYYALGNKQAGPVDEDEFKRLRESGVIRQDTLVWRAGMTGWQPLRSIPGFSHPPFASKAGTGVMPDQPIPGDACSECGRKLPLEQLVEFAGRRVCAECKPAFFLQLQEGFRSRFGGMDYGDFKTRAFAFVIDSVILQAAGILLTAALMPVFAWMGIADGILEKELLLNSIFILAGFAINVFYNVWFVGRFGATPGKLMLGLKVVTANGGRVTYWRAFFRFLAEYLSGCPTLYFGYLMAAWDDETQAMHDRICDTRVIKKA